MSPAQQCELTEATMTREDIAIERALKMYDLLLSVVRSRHVTRLDGSATILEYK